MFQHFVGSCETVRIGSILIIIHCIKVNVTLRFI